MNILAFATLAALFIGDGPEFAAGDPSRLACRIAKPKRDEAGLLAIEVKNRSRLTAEPIRFEVENRSTSRSPGVPDRFELYRTGAPDYGRAGRAIAPSQKRRYLFPMPYGLDPKKARVRVTGASFFRGRGLESPPVEIVSTRVRAAHDDASGLDYEYTEVELENTTDFTVEAILIARGGDLTRPALFMERLAPRERRVAGDASASSSYVGRPSTYSAVRTRFDRIEVIDWSAVVDRGEAIATAALRDAWDSLCRLPGTASISGRVAWRIDPHTENRGLTPSRGEAMFHIPASGGMDVDTDLTGLGLSHLKAAIGSALAELRRPTADELLRDHQVFLDRLGDPMRVRLVHRDDTGCPHCIDPFVDLVDGSVAGFQNALVDVRTVTALATRPARDGCALVEEVRVVDSNRGVETPRRIMRYTYREHSGRVLPASFELEEFVMFGGGRELSTRLEFSDWSIGEPAEAAPTDISGDGVDALREAWEKPYRYPDRPRDVAGRFHVEAPRSSADWGGLAVVEGRFSFQGFRGRPVSGGARVYDDAVIEVATEASEEAREQARQLLEARYTIWSRQDMSARPPFEEAFRGATIERGADPNTFRIRGIDITAVELRNGLPHRIEYLDGAIRRYRYERIDDRPVAVEVRQKFPDRESRVEVSFTRLDDRLFASTITVRDWFFDGFGPEVWTFTPDGEGR